LAKPVNNVNRLIYIFIYLNIGIQYITILYYNFAMKSEIDSLRQRIAELEAGNVELRKENTVIPNTGQMKGNHVTVCHEISVRFQ